MRDEEEPEREQRYFPSKPPASPVIAAIAVAVAIFMLGGFIKTDRQLAELQKEYRRQSEELEWLKRQRSRAGSSLSRRRPSLPVPSLPPAPRATGRLPSYQPPARSAGPVGAVAEPVPIPDTPGLKALAMPASTPPVRHEAPSIADGRRVIAVSDVKGTVLVEGGRDRQAQVGDILQLRREGGIHVADIRVDAVFSTQAVGRVVQQALPPQPGDLVRSDGTGGDVP